MALRSGLRSTLVCACLLIAAAAIPSHSLPGAADLKLDSVLLNFQTERGQETDTGNKLPSVISPSELSELIHKADKLVVYHGEGEHKVIFTSSNRRDLEELNASIVIQPGDGMLCACLGGPVIALFRQGKQIGYLTNQFGHAIRTSLWEMDAVIQDQQKWLHWFDARGIKGPRREFEREMAEAKRSQAAEERWMKAMPASMRDPWERMSYDPIMRPDITPLITGLEKEIPDQKQRIRALLGLFGSGAGPWSGYPAYESVVEDMLLEYSTADLLSAITTAGDSLSDAQIEGAARLLGGWDFGQKRPGDRALIPASLKKMLLEHSLKSRDQDKVGRARHAFGS